MQVNNWSEAEVDRAESTWGQRTPQYSVDMFDFVIEGVKSWLDLGCGFGRFLKYLESKVEDPDYVGYDSSEDMVSRIKKNFPHYSPRLFVHDITAPILNHQEAVLCSAVLIHIPREDQDKVLKNIRAINPRNIAFDINSPCERGMGWLHYKERFIKGSEGTFRMTWQSHYAMTKKIINLFGDYSLTTKFYTVNTNRHKVAYLLRRKSD